MFDSIELKIQLSAHYGIRGCVFVASVPGTLALVWATTHFHEPLDVVDATWSLINDE